MLTAEPLIKKKKNGKCDTLNEAQSIVSSFMSSQLCERELQSTGQLEPRDLAVRREGTSSGSESWLNHRRQRYILT